MKLVLLSILSLFIVSCAHHHKKPEHHHHQYMKKCAYSISHGKLNVAGKDEYKTEHEGKTYFFSSKEKKKKFDTDIAKNITKANEFWSRRR